MAKVSGILLAYPGLKIQLEGHTDSVGSDEYNQKLSEDRADAVRDYLVAQGVPGTTVTACGIRQEQPGRVQRYRRRPAAEPPRGNGGLGRAHRRGLTPIGEGVYQTPP